MSRSTDVGTRWETAIVRYVNSWAGASVCRREVKHGNEDHGDVVLAVDDLTICIEAKWRKSYPNAALERKFREETDRERANAGADGGLLVVNRYRQSTGRAEVWMHHRTACLLHGEDPCSAECGHDWECMRMDDFLTLCFGRKVGE